MFLELGYDNATAQDIIREMGCGPSTFYGFYRNKEELWQAIVDEVAASLSRRLLTGQEDGGRSRFNLRDFYEAFFIEVKSDGDLAALMRKEPSLMRVVAQRCAINAVAHGRLASGAQPVESPR